MKVLVIEDEHKIATSIKKGFEQESWVCDVAFDGEDGFDLASSGDYSVIVLDLMLPKKDGLTIAADLREEGIHTPILMLTAKGEISDKISGFDNGADDYLVKPFAFEELVARVRALTRRPNEIRSEYINIGTISIDTKRQQVYKDKEMINLSRKEYQLFEYLVKNKDKTVSKEEIIAHVWDYDSNILPNTIEVFVKYLRNKLGVDIIKTIRGFGYRINHTLKKN